MNGGFQIGDNFIVGGNNNVGKTVGNPVAPLGERHQPGAKVIWADPLVFINYRSADERAAQDIELDLTRRLGDGVAFRDVHLPAGTEFPRELLDRAARCEVMLSIIGERWDDAHGLSLLRRQDDWVRREIATALDNDVHVVPVLFGARRRLRGGDLPEDIRPIAYLQGPHLVRDYRTQDVHRLVDHLVTLAPLAAALHRARRTGHL